jgi:hypothetical protein
MSTGDGGRFTVSHGACAAAIAVMLVCGTTYRALAERVNRIASQPIRLPLPLASIATDIGRWSGKDVPLSESVIKTAANDDYVNRLYLDESQRQWANLYIAYSARPRTMLGHRPDICYVGAGWVLDSTDKTSFDSKRGLRVPCLLHRLHRPGPLRDEIVVLNFYIVNGVTSNDEELFSGVQWRTPNIEGNIARYVAQVQISSVVENTARSAATEFTDSILDFLPDRQGVVRACKR